METRRIVVFVLTAAILAAAFPETARAAGEDTTARAPKIDLRGAIERAAARLEPAPAAAPARQSSNAKATQAALGGGGGRSKTMLIIDLVGAAVGLGATYYMLKKMREETQQPEGAR